MYVFMYVYAHTWGVKYECTYIWRPEIDTGYFPQLLSTFLF